MAEWFKDWFASKDYLEVYRHRNEADANKLFGLINDNISVRESARVLDIACGAGRHSVLFSLKGYRVSAFDLSRTLLHEAKHKALELGADVNFFCADIRTFELKCCYDLILNLFTSFGYFEEDAENFSVFSKAYSLLRSGGYFIFDYFNAEHLRLNLLPESSHEVNGRSIVQQRSIKDDRVNKKIFIRGLGDEKIFNESVKLYQAAEISRQLKSCGFIIGQKFGDYSGNAFFAESSPRIIIIARKP